MDRDGALALLIEIVRGAPRLSGAACIGQYQLFDDVPGHQTREQRQQRYQAAVQLCEGCPARPACPESLSSQPGETKIPIAG